MNHHPIYSLNLLHQRKQNISLPSLLQNNRVAYSNSIAKCEKQNKKLTQITKKQSFKIRKKKNRDPIFNILSYAFLKLEKITISILTVDGIRPPTRQSAAMVSAGHNIYIYGGIGSSMDCCWWKYDLIKKKWDYKDNIQNSHDQSPSNHCLAYFNNQIWLSGGIIFHYKKSKLRQLNQYYKVYKLSQKDLQFSKSYKMISPRSGHSATVFQKKLVVIGGIDSARRFIQEVQIVNFETSNRFPMTCQNPLLRCFHGACTINRVNSSTGHLQCILIVFGGVTQRQECTDTTYLGTMSGNLFKWKKIDTCGLKPRPRYLHSLIGGQSTNIAIMTGGRNLQREVYNDVYCLDLQVLAWRQVKLNETQFFPRYGHSSAMCGKQVLIFGGVGPKLYMDSKLYILNLQELH